MVKFSKIVEEKDTTMEYSLLHKTQGDRQVAFTFVH